MSELREIRALAGGNGETRTEMFLGREHFVVPVVALQEGVLQGANASSPEYVPCDAIQKNPVQWNGRPIVQNHPQVQGVYVSANSPAIMEEWAYGFVSGAHYSDGKLKCEAWIDVQRAKDLGGDAEETLTRLQNNELVEVSTGLFCDIKPEKGWWNGKVYTGVWDNVVSDHLALLSKGVQGACSVADGCGAPRLNAAAIRTFEPAAAECGCGGHEATCTCEDEEPTTMEAAEQLARAQAAMLMHAQSVAANVTLNDVFSVLSSALKARFEAMEGCAYAYLIDATTDVVVFRRYDSEWRAETFQMRYAMDERGNVTFSGEPEPVILMTQILPKPKVNASGEGDGSAEGAGEAEGTQPADSQTGGTTVISSNEHRGDAMAGEQPGTAADPSAAAPATGITAPAAPAAPPSGGEANPTVNSAAPQAPRFNSVDDVLRAVPPAMAEYFEEGMRLQAERRSTLITTIKANANNRFDDASLNGMNITTLQGLAALAATPPAPAADPKPPVENYYAGRYASETNPAVQDPNAQPHVQGQQTGIGGAPLPQSLNVQSGGNSDFYRPGTHRVN